MPWLLNSDSKQVLNEALNVDFGQGASKTLGLSKGPEGRSSCVIEHNFEKGYFLVTFKVDRYALYLSSFLSFFVRQHLGVFIEVGLDA